MNPSGHILIIDDEATLRQTLARILQRAGYEVTSAESGEQALELIAGAVFDLVYMDLRMPGLPGIEALKHIHSRFPDLPVILFTAQPDLNSAVEALRLGATDYLLKPLQPEAFLEHTRRILSRQEKERRKREIQTQITSLQDELKKLEGEETPIESASPPPVQPGSERFLTRGKMVLDLHTRRVTVGGRAASLSPATFDYLLVLARHAPNVVDYQTLVAEAQGYQTDLREAQELTKWHIHHIRQAVETDAQNPSLLINVRGRGYRLVAD